MTDQEIYNGILKRDNATFSYMYNEYKSMIFSMIQKNNGGEEDAMDILQEGLLALWTNVKLGKFDLQKNAKISTYLYTLCRNLWISEIRKSKTMQIVSDSESLQIADSAGEAEEQYSQVKMIQRQLEKLGDHCKQLLTWFYYEKKSMRDIATLLNITEKSAKNSKYRCMQNMRAQYIKAQDNES